MLRVEGRVFFLNVEQIAEKIQALIAEYKPTVVAIDMQGVIDLEYSALKMLTEAEQRRRESGVSLWLVEMSSQVFATVQRAPLGKTLGREGRVPVSRDRGGKVSKHANNPGKTMSDTTIKEAGTIQVMLQRLNEYRLPKALDLKKKVDRGEKLDSYDIEFLETVLTDANHAQGLVKKHPEIQSLVGKLMSLYSEITTKGLENEQKKG